MASDRLVKFAIGVNNGLSLAQAAIEAGYAEATARHHASSLQEKARRAGLLVDPGVVRDFVTMLEAALPDAADELIKLAKGGSPGSPVHLDAIRELIDRARGRSKATLDVTTAGQPIIPVVFRPATDDEPGGE